MKVNSIVRLVTIAFVMATAMAVLFVNPSAAHEVRLPDLIPSNACHGIEVAEHLQMN